MKKHHVYHLIDPDTGQVKYVGKSTNPRSRLNQHIAESLISASTEKKVWIKKLIDAEKRPVMVIVFTTSNDEIAREVESTQCHLHKSTILNIHDPKKGAKDLHKITTGTEK